MNETDSKRLRHHTPVLPAKQDVAAEKARLDAQYDEATALGESEAGYSAAQRLLDEAVDAAMRPLPVWQERSDPPQPKKPEIKHELRLSCGETLTVSPWCSSGNELWLYMGISKRLTAASIDDGRAKAVPMMIDLLERTLAELRFYQQHLTQARKPSNGQPSVTKAARGNIHAFEPSHISESTAGAQRSR